MKQIGWNVMPDVTCRIAVGSHASWELSVIAFTIVNGASLLDVMDIARSVSLTYIVQINASKWHIYKDYSHNYLYLLQLVLEEPNLQHTACHRKQEILLECLEWLHEIWLTRVVHESINISLLLFFDHILIEIDMCHSTIIIKDLTSRLLCLLWIFVNAILLVECVSWKVMDHVGCDIFAGRRMVMHWEVVPHEWKLMNISFY